MDLAFLSLVASSTSSGMSVSLADVATDRVYNYLIQTDLFLAAGAIYFVPKILGSTAFGKIVLNNEWVVRFLPFYPLIAASVLVLLPGAVSLPNRQLGTLAIASIWTAAISMFLHKIIGQTVLGDDPRIETMAVISPGQYEPVLPKTKQE